MKTTRNSHKSIRLLRTVCVTLSNVCLSAAETAEWGTLLPWWLPLCRGSQESIPHRGQAVHCSEEGDGLLDHEDPVQEIHGQIQNASSHFQVLKQQQQQLAGSRGSKNFKSLFRVVVLTKFKPASQSTKNTSHFIFSSSVCD